MKIKKVKLKHFKRFDDLTINLGDSPREIIALVGPNGCGKSSIFDAFEEKLKDFKGANNSLQPHFFSKLWFSIFSEKKTETYNKNNSIEIITNGANNSLDKKSFYIRSSYRFTPRLNVANIRTLPDVIDDRNRPSSSIDIDSRLQENYERLLGQSWNEYQNGTKSGPVMREELVGTINNILKNVVDIKISNLGNVIAGKGQLYFEKETSKDFPYENLSAGEKEVVDIIIDLVVKTKEFNDTVYCIDEPELHLNTAIQRNLLIEVYKLIPENCQLWLATHSIGFLRALQEDLKDKCSILDFSEKDYFNRTCEISPIKTTRKNWQRIFQTALEDLTGLIAPKQIIYCEGKTAPSASKDEQGLDAEIYNGIFAEEFHDTLFVSSGGCGEMMRNSVIALKIINKAFVNVELYRLKDRDNLIDEDRETFLNAEKNNRMLERHEIENYLFDKEVLTKFCLGKDVNFDETEYNTLIKDISKDDLKLVQQKIQHLCGYSGKVEDFKMELSKYILQDTTIYGLLKKAIFNI